MAYDKNVWNCGDEITAEKLNHMEDGIANAGGGGSADPVFIEGELLLADYYTVDIYTENAYQQIVDATKKGVPVGFVIFPTLGNLVETMTLTSLDEAAGHAFFTGYKIANNETGTLVRHILIVTSQNTGIYREYEE